MMIKNNRKRRYLPCLKSVIFMSLFFVAILVGTGCSQKENNNEIKNVEERDYVTVLMISEGREKAYRFTLGTAQEKKRGEKSQSEELSEWESDNFEDLSDQYKKVKGKTLSLSHLKIILLAMTNHDITNYELKDLFFLMDENKEIAKTCPVLFLFDQTRFMEFLEKEKKSVGTYMDSLVKETETADEKIPWVKDYLKAIQEEKEMDSYYLKPALQGWMIDKIRELCI